MALNRRGIVGLAGEALCAGLLLGGVARAQADSALPAVQKSGAVEYLSGGIGLDESTAIQSASRHWPAGDKPHRNGGGRFGTPPAFHTW